MHGTLRTLTNGYIGPVPADDMLIIDELKISFVDSSTCLTKGSLGDVLAADSPWISLASMSLPNPFSLRWSLSRENCFSGIIFGMSLKSNLAVAMAGKTVFA